jgi:isoamylase
MDHKMNVFPGKSFPLGATVYPDGVNFCVFSKSCHFVELLLFDGPEDEAPSQTIRLDPNINRTFYYWHVFIKGIKSGQLYGYRVHGPWLPANGNLFDKDKVLVDPYAKSLYVGKYYSREAATYPGDNCAQAIKNVVVDTDEYNWEGDKHLNIPYSETVIYEMHVKGFTNNPNSGVPDSKRGTYAGLIDKIPYLKSLGITAVELMPVQQFDEQDAVPPLKNYWGYSPINFFSPHFGYSSDKSPLGPINEFRDMVKAFHQAGIEVILDVVFNHTAEGEPDGPIFSFKGFENRSYYILKENKAFYADYTGCGNTLNANHSVVRRLIRDALRFWVAEMHVDGFRFDLASVLSRDEMGKPLDNPPILWEIETDPVMAGTKIIAEAWDAAGLYQVGSFVGDKWAEWNGQYRDDVRRFVRGDVDSVTKLASRIIGSPDIYTDPDRKINRSINFITCHDGFTLNDLVSYNKKHNEENGEKNMDGSDHNFSWNCGVEGTSSDPEIEKLRLRQMKNFLSILFMSQGTPMILMGDEVRRTQKGNNNAYCQDNEISWFDWDLLNVNAGMLRFTKGLIQFVSSLKLFQLDTMLKTSYHTRSAHIIWHGVKLAKPDLSHHSHTLAFTLNYPKAHESVHVMLNAYREPLDFEIPLLHHDSHWVRIVDTSLPTPDDITLPGEAPMIDMFTMKLGAYSVAILMAMKKDGRTSSHH